MGRVLVALLLVALFQRSYAVQDCYEEDSTLADVRSILGCRDCTIKNVDPLVWSGWTTKESRGGGWANFDIDQVDYNVPDALQHKYYKRVSGDLNHVHIQRNGIYFIHHISFAFSTGGEGIWSRVHINDAVRDYYHWSHARATKTNYHSLFLPLEANNRVSVSCHATGGDPYRYKKNQNGLQLSYVGNKEEVVFLSAACNHHTRVYHWRRLCLNHIDFKNVKTQGFLDHYTDGRVVVLKSGFYRLLARVMVHGHHGGKQAVIRVNGVNRAFSEGTNHAWLFLTTDITLALKEDDLVEVYTQAIGHDPYSNHAHNPSVHHAELQVVRVGDLGDYDFTDSSPANMATGAVKLLQGGPATINRDNNWTPIRIQRKGHVSMPDSAATFDAVSGDITIGTAGWYRIHAAAAVYSDAEAMKQGKITVGGKVKQTYKVSAQGWQQIQLDYIFKAAAGTVVQAAVKTDGNNPQIANFSPKDGATFVEVVKLEW